MQQSSSVAAIKDAHAVSILYASKYGRTRKVATELARFLGAEGSVADVSSDSVIGPPSSARFCIVLCPNYGDEELPEQMEMFLQRCSKDWRGKAFAVVELGNYYGYEFDFGAVHVIQRTLAGFGATEICEPLSLDSYPLLPWEHFWDWAKLLSEKINHA